MKTFHWFRKIGMAEGISFLVLLFIAMPLKYFLGQPMAVTIVGALHGVLFILFVIMAFEVKSQHHKTMTWFLKAFAASVIPFGTFFMDKEWKKEQQALFVK